MWSDYAVLGFLVPTVETKSESNLQTLPQNHAEEVMDEEERLQMLISARNDPLCGCCGKQPAKNAHFCPLKEAKEADNDFLCNCCDECKMECWEGT